MALFNLFKLKARHTHDDITNSIISFFAKHDFETLEEYQIEEYDKNLGLASVEMAKAEAVMNEDLTTYNTIQNTLTRNLNNINKINEGLTSGSIAEENKAKFTAKLEELVVETEQIKETLAEAKERYDSSADFFNTWRESVEVAGTRLVNSKKVLADKKRELERATKDAETEARRAESRKEALGIKTAIDPLSTVTSALDKEIAAKKQAAAASKNAANALGANSKKNDADIDSFLNEVTVTPKVSSLTDRLKALNASK